MPDDYEQLDKLLGGPRRIITVGGDEIRLYPAGLPEVLDVQRKLKALGVKPGDFLPGQDEEPIDADGYAREEMHAEFWSYCFWLCIRQGTPGMTTEKLLKEQWEEKFKADYAQRLLSIYMRAEGSDSYVLTAITLCKEVGLFRSGAEEDVDEDAPKGESTQTSSPPKSSEINTEPQAEVNGDESGLHSSENSE